jgi:hypothetical protein
MPLVRLIYASQSTELAKLDILVSILKVARKNNKKGGITGILCYDPKYFLQWLEGPRDSINNLYSIIMKDPRHKNVTLLDYQEISVRTFERWSMAYASTSKANRSLLFKYSVGLSFDPYNLNAEGARGFLMELSKENEKSLDRTFTDDDFAD